MWAVPNKVIFSSSLQLSRYVFEYTLRFCKFWAARRNVVYRFLVPVAHPTHWISAGFYNSSMVRSCGQSLVLCSDY